MSDKPTSLIPDDQASSPVEEYRKSVIGRFQFDIPAATPGADNPPFEDRFASMNLAPSLEPDPHCTSGGKPGCTCDGCF